MILGRGCYILEAWASSGLVALVTGRLYEPERAQANSVNATNPWFIRGGQSANLANAGVESINNNNGAVNTTNGFRGVVVLLPWDGADWEARVS